MQNDPTKAKSDSEHDATNQPGQDGKESATQDPHTQGTDAEGHVRSRSADPGQSSGGGFTNEDDDAAER